ncbi:MAG: flavodoxin family protein [Cyanobacteria bacterium P01_F01_bin.150]
MKISVIHFSGSGHTKKMAEAVLSGVKRAENCQSSLIEIQGTDISNGRWKNDAVLAELDASDAIIFGSPTYMGSVAAQMKAFMDATGERYFSQAWKDKVASAFTVSGGPSGDKSNSLITFATFAMQQGMIWVGLGMTAINDDETNRLGFYFGAGGQALMEPPDEAPNNADKKTGELLGYRVAQITNKLTS